MQPTQPDEAHTPEQSPRRQTVGITAAQKQALIDNLQLEGTAIVSVMLQEGYN